MSVNENNNQTKTPSIVITELHKSYGKKQVLKGLNLEVFPGELFGFIGKNGIGKSTTIDCVIGSKKFNSGTITLNGYDIKNEPLLAKSQFGYVASEPSCYDVMTGYEYLEFIASIYNVSEGDFVRNMRYLCNRLKLDQKELGNRIANYSHGMKQKLCLVGSLLYNPSIWILDEPTVGLDIMAVEELPAENEEKPEGFQDEEELDIELKDVSFKYQNGDIILNPFHFSADSGEIIAITGPSGEGKTTLLRLLLGLVEPCQGQAVLKGKKGK